jgi:hypothetical protein
MHGWLLMIPQSVESRALRGRRWVGTMTETSKHIRWTDSCKYIGKLEYRREELAVPFDALSIEQRSKGAAIKLATGVRALRAGESDGGRRTSVANQFPISSVARWFTPCSHHAIVCSSTDIAYRDMRPDDHGACYIGGCAAPCCFAPCFTLLACLLILCYLSALVP